MNQDEKYMREAIKEAKKAYRLGEVPIGCVIVYEDKVIGRGYNRRNTDKSTLAHAEIRAIAKASKKLNDWRLENCTMYVTLEPCQMCSGAIVQARIPRVVMGCRNAKAGCAGSILNILQCPSFNHQVEIQEGVLKEESSTILQSFFGELRERTREEQEQKKAFVPTGKPLSEYTQEELWQLFPIVLKEYNTSYPKWYEEKRIEIMKVMSDCGVGVYRISHIGSTSVPGLLSKPTIDILLELKKDGQATKLGDERFEVPDSDPIGRVVTALRENGWILMSQEENPFHYVFNQGYTPYGFEEKVYHLHVRMADDWNELYFAEYLRQNPQIATKYGKLKLSLLKKYEHNRDGYTAAKTDFIVSHTAKARAQNKNQFHPEKSHLTKGKRKCNIPKVK